MWFAAPGLTFLYAFWILVKFATKIYTKRKLASTWLSERYESSHLRLRRVMIKYS